MEVGACQSLINVSVNVGHNEVAFVILEFPIFHRGGFLLLSFPYTFTTFTNQSTVVILEHMTQKEGM